MENITPISLPTEIWEEAGQENEPVFFKRDYETGSLQAWGQNAEPINTGGAYLRNKLNQHQAEEWVTKQSHFTFKSLSSGRLALTWLLTLRLNTQISRLRRGGLSETCLAHEYSAQLRTRAWGAELWGSSHTRLLQVRSVFFGALLRPPCITDIPCQYSSHIFDCIQV